jgi:hypothetical protein
MLAQLFSSRETYRVHGAAHPSALKARALALRMARLALAEQTLESKCARVMSRTPAESQGPERDSEGDVARKTGGRRSGDDGFMAGEPRASMVGTQSISSTSRVGDDPATIFPALAWRGDRVYFAGDDRGYRTLAEALAAWRGRAA